MLCDLFVIFLTCFVKALRYYNDTVEKKFVITTHSSFGSLKTDNSSLNANYVRKESS
jgi:hypothetical protein